MTRTVKLMTVALARTASAGATEPGDTTLDELPTPHGPAEMRVRVKMDPSPE